MLIRVLDVETTGFHDGARVVEIGWTDLTQTRGKWALDTPEARLVNPGAPIPPEASAVHHIVDAMVAEAPALADVIRDEQIVDEGVDIYAAHNVAFESRFVFVEPAQWICTYKAALRLAPKAPAHKNQVLRYWLGLELDPALCTPPHRAGPDSYVTAALLARMLAKHPPEELLRLTAEPALLPRLTFGKHAGQWLEDVPTDYLQWMVGQAASMDPDAISTARHHLDLRAAAKPMEDVS